MRISVIGCGYLGAVHAATLASMGHSVVGIDVEVATEALLPHLAAGSAVVGKSTVPVGTVDMLRGVLSPRPDVLLGWNPEFLRQGTAVKDSLVPDRLVYGVPGDGPGGDNTPDDALRDGVPGDGHGGDNDISAPDTGAAVTAVLDAVYEPLLAAGIPRLVCNFATAELIKSASNAYLATKLSFINAMAELCDATGADVKQLGAAMGFDPRIGSRYLHAGLGFGGGCLPKDIRSLRVQAADLGVDSVDRWMAVVDSINRDQRSRTVGLARELCGGRLGGRRVTVLGAAFKPDTDDIRDSPALAVALQLASAGAHVTVTDPAAINNAWLRYPQLRFEPSTSAALEGAELVLLLTEWDEYASLRPAAAGALVRRRILLDARNAVDAAAWDAAGWTVRGLGRGRGRARRTAGLKTGR